MENKKFRISAKDFSVTLPKCSVLPEDALRVYTSLFSKKATYIAVVKENHEDGSPHLHAHLQFSSSYNLTDCKKFDLHWSGVDYHANVQRTKSSQAWYDYMRKVNDPQVWGNFTVLTSTKNSNDKKAINNKIITEDLTKLVDEGFISIYNYKQLSEAKRAYLNDKNKPESIFPRVCYWIYGKPGIGKSYWVRSRYPNIYIKSQNKWWDGYSGETEILIDDFDCEQLGHMLKIWADSYSFTAEVKNSFVRPVYTKLFLTSNYLPADLFKGDVLVEAVTRRFTFCTIINYELRDLYNDNLIII